MSTGALPRHLLKWVLSLDLTYPIKHPRRDFANGFLVAELLSCYFPADIQLHSYSNVHSLERKKNNWYLLDKFFKARGFGASTTTHGALHLCNTLKTLARLQKYDLDVSAQQMQEVMDAKGDAAVQLLQTLFAYVHHPEGQTAASLDAAPLMQPGEDRGQAFMGPGAQQEAWMHGWQAPDTSQGAGVAPQMGDWWSVPQQPQLGMIPAAYPGYRQEQQPQEPPGNAAQMHLPQHQMPPGHAGLVHLQTAAAGVDPAAGQWGYASPGPQAPPQQQAQHLLPSLPHPQHNPWPPHPVLGQQASYQQPPAHPQQAYQQAGDPWQQQAAPGTGVPGAPQQAGLARQQAPLQQQATIEYDKRPRPVRFTPYTHEDYVQRNYDSKTQKGYWALGSLGPGNEDQELLAKRKKANDVKELGRTIREANARLAAAIPTALKPKQEAAKRPTAREKAWEFARTLPRPEIKPSSSSSPAAESAAAAPEQPESELDRLQAQHAAHQNKVDSIRQEFANLRT